MPSAEYDLRYLRAGIDQLEEYLLSNDLYWPINASAPAGEPPYPQLTPGSLLLARQRLQATLQTQTEQEQAGKLIERFNAVMMQWRTAWGKKCAADFHSRLRLWGDYLNEYRERPAANFDRYGYEVTRRVQLHLLRPQAVDLPDAELENMGGLDKLLKAVFVHGAFVWPDELLPAFPEGIFWFLYGGVSRDLKGSDY
jgi:hypothetical protein